MCENDVVKSWTGLALLAVGVSPAVASAQPAVQPAPAPTQPPATQPAPAPPPGGQPAQPPAAQPAPAPPLPGDPAQGQPPPQLPPQPPPAYPPPYAQPPPGQPPPYAYPYPYPYVPPVGPPPPPLPPEEPTCCRIGVRFDPFDLIFRRLSFQAEVGIWGPFSIEAEPSWIFGSPDENIDTKGGALAGNFLVYFTGRYLRGFYVKASVGFEKYEATVTDEQLHKSSTGDVASPVLGIGIGSSTIFGNDDVGFNLAGGVGIGFATADPVTITAGRYTVVFYENSPTISLQASLGLGIAFGP